MNKKETMEEIKKMFKSLMSFSSALKNEEFSNFDLTDGTKITSPSKELEVGSEVYSLDDQGNQTPLDDGEYVLTDGRTITIKANIIEVISESPEGQEEKPEETPAEGEEPAEEKMESGLPDGHQEEAKGEQPADLENRIKDLESQIEDIMNILSKLGTTQNEVNEQMMSKMESISNENGDTPIKSRKKESPVSYKPGKSDFRDELKEYLKNKKKEKSQK